MTDQNFKDFSYSKHENHNNLERGYLSELQKTWLNEDTVDYWRHKRMYSPLKPLLIHSPNTKWITVGDGRMGLDSIRLNEIEPSLKILPSDISIELLEFSKQKGYISDYSKQNAEEFSFSDNEFDYSFCKESYHHFPRPYIALYEMLRISKTGVILIEPNDNYPSPWLKLLKLKSKNIIKRILGKTIYHHDHWNYEEIGNYIYSISVREIEKVALGLNFSTIAYCYFNDYYEPGVENEKVDINSKLFKKVKSKIRYSDLYCKIGLKNYTHLICIIFKKEPDLKLKKELESSKFKVVDLPRNPYFNL